MSALSRSSGQATVLTVLFLTALIGATAAVLDVGGWFRADRKLQANTDAAALAGAQALPANTGQASMLALDYGKRNGGDIDSGDIAFESRVIVNDTIVIDAEKDVRGVFSGLFGLDSVEVHARAKARTGTVASARYVAPIVVNWKHPMLKCNPPPCPGRTTINLMDLHDPGSGNAAGSFGLINLDRADRGTAGDPILADWILTGFDGYMELGRYRSVPSAQFNSSLFKNALEHRLGRELLFPIYRTIEGAGETAEYDVIGWVGFVPEKFDGSGAAGSLTGTFKRVIWQGIPTTRATQQAFGAYAVVLVE
ncbi:MAG: pilus assembly protein TadG-related protein [Actinomycetota bacterium]|nr:pilus assembly protein TadG-related protein [Actinomycetota bacterium]